MALGAIAVGLTLQPTDLPHIWHSHPVRQCVVAAQRTIIEAGVAAGCFRPIDPAFAYFIIVGACRDFFTNKITVKTVLGGEPDEATVDRYVQTVTDFLFNGLSAR